MAKPVSTWADGFGVWHARVTDSGNAVKDRRKAYRAIREEIAVRSAEGVRFRVRLAVVEKGDGFTVYCES